MLALLEICLQTPKRFEHSYIRSGSLAKWLERHKGLSYILDRVRAAVTVFRSYVTLFDIYFVGTVTEDLDQQTILV